MATEVIATKLCGTRERWALDGTEVQTSLTSSESSITLPRQQFGWIRKTGLPHCWFESSQVGSMGVSYFGVVSNDQWASPS